MSHLLFIHKLHEQHKNYTITFPDKERAETFMDNFLKFLFFPKCQSVHCEEELSNEFLSFKIQLSVLIKEVLEDDKTAATITDDFFLEVEEIYDALLLDAAAIFKFDPAANSIEEVLVAYPGFYATAVYRFSNFLWNKGVKILPRLFSEYAHSKTGIDIHPGATIGKSFFIDHGTGIVIGETSVIGNHVRMYQGVTLGALSVSKNLAKSKRHPTIGDHVIIYSGATILGGETIIGNDSVVGGNVWLISSVPPNSVVYHKSEITIRDKNNFS